MRLLDLDVVEARVLERRVDAGRAKEARALAPDRLEQLGWGLIGELAHQFAFP